MNLHVSVRKDNDTTKMITELKKKITFIIATSTSQSTKIYLHIKKEVKDTVNKFFLASSPL